MTTEPLPGTDVVRTYGRLRWYPPEQSETRRIPRALWHLTLEPHVMMRVKRLFPQANQRRTGALVLADTPALARDLEMIATRWPLDMDASARRRLAERADADRERDRVVRDILAGHRPPDSWLAPAREPRQYQLDADAVIAVTGSLLLGDDVGMGKTFTSLLRLRDPAALPALVVTLTHLPGQWLGELEKSLPWLTGHVVTRSTPYDPRERRGVTRTPDVLFMNYAKLAGWGDHLAGFVRTVIFDEAQELRTGPGTAKYDAACLVAHPAQFVWELTATPVYNYGGETWNLVNVSAPDALGTREEFIREWGSETAAGGHVKVRDPAALGTYLRDQGLMLARTRKDVGMELPETIRVPHDVNVDGDTLDKAMADHGVSGFAEVVLGGSSRKERFLASGELDWRMRAATGVAKAPYVAEFVRLLLESEERVVLFGWHRDVYDIWLDRLRPFSPAMYTGTESPSRKARNARSFLDGDSRVLLMSLRAGAGLDGLQEACHVGVFGELDWSPQVHKQCEGRLRRDGMGEPVLAYYLTTDSGSDPVVMEVLGVKRRQGEPIMDPTWGEAGGALAADTSDRIRRLARAVTARR